MDELDKRGMEILRFLARLESGGQGPPTMREVARAAGLKSSRSGQERLAALEEAGYVERTPGPRRSRRPAHLTEEGWEALSSVPALGRIAAGRGIEPIRRVGEVVPLGGFSLEAEGDSMVGAGIENGDRLLFSPDPSPPDGSIVAALLVSNGDARVTVKRLFRENGSVRLRPENDSYKDLIVAAEDVEIQGKLEWILRRPSR